MALLVPEYLQTQKYSAKRDRLTLQHGGSVQGGVFDPNDFKVIQRALGANMTVDVNAGAALVPANDPGNAGLYHIVNDASLLGTTVANAHATLPRIDSVYALVLDSTDGGDGSDGVSIVCATGTATAGTTLDLRTGAPALPTGALLLADILVPAASSSVVTANIRDRRPWARGLCTQLAATSNTSNATTTMTPITGLTGRCEFSGAPALVTFSGAIQGSAANTGGNAQVLIDGVVNSFFDTGLISAPTAGLAYGVNGTYMTPSLAGSRVISAAFASAAAVSITMVGTGVAQARVTIIEMPRQLANNT